MTIWVFRLDGYVR